VSWLIHTELNESCLTCENLQDRDFGIYIAPCRTRHVTHEAFDSISMSHITEVFAHT